MDHGLTGIAVIVLYYIIIQCNLQNCKGRTVVVTFAIRLFYTYLSPPLQLEHYRFTRSVSFYNFLSITYTPYTYTCTTVLNIIYGRFVVVCLFRFTLLSSLHYFIIIYNTSWVGITYRYTRRTLSANTPEAIND